MGIVEGLRLIFVAACVRFAAIGLSDVLISKDQFDGWVSIVYIPAGINVIMVLAWGIPAAAGIALGSLFLNLGVRGLDFLSGTSLALMSGVSCTLSYWLASKLRVENRSMDGWTVITFNEVVLFTLGYAFINSSLHHAIFSALLPKVEFSWTSYALMMVGDVFGTVMVFSFGIFLFAGWVQLKKWNSR